MSNQRTEAEIEAQRRFEAGVPMPVAPTPQTIEASLEEVASYIGSLYAAAKHDLESASPGDVGLDGVSIVGWRQGYLEGCKDMAEGIITRLPESERERLRPKMLAAFHAETSTLTDKKISP